MINADLLGLAHPISSLSTLPGNPRKGDIDAVAASLKRFGQRKPIVARASDRVVIAGNHTLQAALLLGWDAIAVSFVHEDEQESLAFALADNRTSELGSYDDAALLEVIQSVGDFDASLLVDAGWDAAAVSDLVNSINPHVPDPVDEDEVWIPSAPAVTISKRNDVWLLDRHRIMCGDCRDTADVDELLAGAKINVAFTSPPYASQRTYDESSGFTPIPPDEYVDWFSPVAENVKAHLALDGSWFVNIKAASVGLDQFLYTFDLVTAHAKRWGWHFATEFCWERNGLPGSPSRRFKNQFESIYQFALNDWKFRPDSVRHFSPEAKNISGSQPHASNVQGISNGMGDAYFEPGLAYPGNRISPLSGSHEALGHPAAFPVGLPTFFVKAYSDPDDVIYDPFMGSGSTLLAAHLNDRVGFGMEVSPGYVDVICTRFQRRTGIIPVLESTNEQHDFLGFADA